MTASGRTRRRRARVDAGSPPRGSRLFSSRRSGWSFPWLLFAGFGPDEIAVTAEQNVLTVEGRKSDKHQHEYLYQGISARPFKRQFNLADYVQVKSATFDNGLLRVELVREIPEAMKPRRIAIGGGASTGQITKKAA